MVDHPPCSLVNFTPPPYHFLGGKFRARKPRGDLLNAFDEGFVIDECLQRRF